MRRFHILFARISHALDKFRRAVYAIIIYRMIKEAIAVEDFKKGDRVLWKETGQSGTVSTQFVDGYVSLILDSGSPAELLAFNLEKLEAPASRR